MASKLNKGENKRKDGTYQFRYKDDLSDKYKYIYAKTLEELRKKEQEIFVLKIQGIESTNMTVDELFQRYIVYQTNLVKLTTLEGYKQRYFSRISPYLGFYKINDVTYSLIVKYFKTLENELKAGSISNLHCILSGMFRLAVRDKILNYNPMIDTLKVVKRTADTSTKENVPLTQQQIESLYKWLDKPYWEMQKNRITMLLYAGLRISELAGLLWEDVDFENNVIHIKHNLCYHLVNGKHQMIMQTPKSKSGIRDIPMLPIIRNMLLEMRQKQKVIVSYNGYFGFVFTTRENQPLKKNSFEKSLKDMVKTYNKHNEVKIERLTPHLLRHTFCSNLYVNGVNLKVIQEVMGHSNVDLTFSRYTHINNDFKQEELFKMCP